MIKYFLSPIKVFDITKSRQRRKKRVSKSQKSSFHVVQIFFEEHRESRSREPRGPQPLDNYEKADRVWERLLSAHQFGDCLITVATSERERRCLIKKLFNAPVFSKKKFRCIEVYKFFFLIFHIYFLCRFNFSILCRVIKSYMFRYLFVNPLSYR